MNDSSSNSKQNSALLIALIGALVTASGYIATYYKDLVIQEKKQKHDFVVALLRDDPRESSANLLWASHADLLELSPETITQLKDSPFDAPTKSENNDSEESINLKDISGIDIGTLVRGLNSETKSVRWKSLEALETRYPSDQAVIELIVEYLAGNKLDSLSANGRYNHLYYLNEVKWDAMDSETKGAVKTTLTEIRARSEEGIAAIGTQTMQLIQSIESKL